jgi:hypothetical protein
MKALKNLFIIALVAGFAAVASTSFANTDTKPETVEFSNPSGLVKIYLENKCGSSVKVKAERPGTSGTYTINGNTKKPLSFAEGTKIVVDGTTIVEVTADCAGKTYTVCD